MTADGQRPSVLISIGIIILVEIIFGILYTVKTPRWEAPDEPAQFNYVRHVAETGTLPVLRAGDYDQVYLEKIKAKKFPPTLSIDAIRYESYAPPLYYLVAAPVYLFARATGLDEVIALRLFSVMLGATLLVLAYRLFTQVFPAIPLLAAAGVAFMATVPMHIAMSAAVNADTFAEVVLAVLLLVCLARARGTLSDRRFVLGGGLLYGLALMTSIKIYPSGLLPILAEMGFISWSLKVGSKPNGGNQPSPPGNRSMSPAGMFRQWGGRETLFRSARVLFFLFGLSLIVSFWWFARNILVYGGGDFLGLARHDLVVTGQPTTVEWVAKFGLKNVLADFFIITFKSFWAQFGWMGVLVNDRIYVGLFVLTVIAILGAVMWIRRHVRERGEHLRGTEWIWGILGAWLLVVLLDYAFYNLRYFQPQGRYLFPALVPIAAFGVAGLYEILDKRYVRLIFALLYIVMLGLDYVSLFWFIIPQLKI